MDMRSPRAGNTTDEVRIFKEAVPKPSRFESAHASPSDCVNGDEDAPLTSPQAISEGVEKRNVKEPSHPEELTVVSLDQVSPPPFDDVTKAMQAAQCRPRYPYAAPGTSALGYNLAADREYNYRTGWHLMYETVSPDQDLCEATRRFRVAAKMGCPASLTQLALASLFGIGIAVSTLHAAKLLNNAVEKGSVDALEVRALCHMDGTFDGKRKYSRALNVLRLGIQRRSTSCLLWEALCFEVGLGVTPDTQRAMRTYRTVAENSELRETLDDAYPGALQVRNPWMLLKMALFFMHCDSRSEGMKRAQKCLESAAGLGLADAQFYLSMCFLHGRCGEKNIGRALFWLHWAADRDSPHEVARRMLKSLTAQISVG